VEEPLHAVEFLLHHLGHVGGGHRRVGSRVDRAHGERRWRNGRILFHRQHPQRDNPAQQDGQRDHPREDRTVDEEPGGHGTTCTTAPGPIFCNPSVITRSPMTRPLSMVHMSPCSEPRITGRIATESPLPTTYTMPPSGVTVTAR